MSEHKLVNQIKEIQENSENANSIVENSSILKLPTNQGFKGNQKACYVPYNYKYYDRGWGCAWRAIQTVLSAYRQRKELTEPKGQIDFRRLFLEYSQKNRLNQIIDSLYDPSIAAKIKSAQYAPEQVSNNWAEPFICHLICQEKKIDSKLFLLNKFPNANAPQEAFLEKPVNFKQFVAILNQNIAHSPVMIDDGILAMSILAYKKNENNDHELIIGDPHVLSNKKQPMDVGIYKVILNSEGEKLRFEIDQEAYKQRYCDTMTGMDFSKKGWMFMYTAGNQI